MQIIDIRDVEKTLLKLIEGVKERKTKMRLSLAQKKSPFLEKNTMLI